MLNFNSHRNSPKRSPDWRWQRASQYVESPCAATRPSQRRDGRGSVGIIRTAIKFKAAYEACENDYAKLELIDKYPDIFWAYELYLQAEPTRYAIEAYILARETDKEIGYRFGLSPSIVASYEELFFNVRDYLQNQGYVVTVVIGEALQKGLYERQYDLLWKLCGYMGGPFVLDAMIGKYTQMAWASGPNDVSASWQDLAVGTMKMKAAQAALTVPVNQQTCIALLDIFNKYVEVERTTQSQGQAKEAILENISAMLKTLPFSVAGQAGAERHMTAFYHTNGAELRYEEHFLASVGMPVPNIPLLDTMEYPKG